MKPKIQYISTSAFAERLGIKPDTIRRALCINGHYLNLRPLKLPTGRLLWPDIEPEKLAVS